MLLGHGIEMRSVRQASGAVGGFEILEGRGRVMVAINAQALRRWRLD